MELKDNIFLHFCDNDMEKNVVQFLRSLEDKNQFVIFFFVFIVVLNKESGTISLIIRSTEEENVINNISLI